MVHAKPFVIIPGYYSGAAHKVRLLFFIRQYSCFRIEKSVTDSIFEDINI